MVSFYKPVFQLKTPGYLQGFSAIRFASCPTVYSFSRPFYLIFFAKQLRVYVDITFGELLQGKNRKNSSKYSLNIILTKKLF